MWSWSADELLRRAGSDDPTPGSGAVAAAAGVLGVVLVRKAIAVTGEPAVALDARAAVLEEHARAAADADVVAFGALIDARGMAQDDAGERAARDAAVEAALRSATEGPLALVATLVDALHLAADTLPLVQRELESDVLAGADLMRGAARAALRAVDLDLDELERTGSADAQGLRERRDKVVAALEAATEP